MSIPTTPVLSLTYISAVSFQVAITGADVGTTQTVFYQQIDFPSLPVQSFNITGNGTNILAGLNQGSHWLVWAVSSNGSSYSLPTLGNISLATSSTLLNAIKDKWYSTLGLTSLVTGGLYLSQIPDTDPQGERRDPPYCTCDQDHTRFEWTETSLFYEITTVEFNFFTPGSAQNLEQILAEIRATFDWKTLTFGDGLSSSTYIQPLAFNFSAEPVRYRDTSLMYRGCMRYEFWINRTFSNYT